MGPFPETDAGNKYFIVIMDYCTKWPDAYALPNQEARTVARVWRFAANNHYDQARNFESTVFTEMCQLLDVHKSRTTALHPQSDGMIERYNRTLERQLAMFVGEYQGTWDHKFPLLLMSYRSAVHDTTKCTPSLLMFGREMRLPIDLIYGRPDDTPVTYCEYVSDLRTLPTSLLARRLALLMSGRNAAMTYALSKDDLRSVMRCGCSTHSGRKASVPS